MRTFLEDSFVEFLLRAICSDFMGINFSSCSCLKIPTFVGKDKNLSCIHEAHKLIFFTESQTPKKLRLIDLR